MRWASSPRCCSRSCSSASSRCRCSTSSIPSSTTLSPEWASPRRVVTSDRVHQAQRRVLRALAAPGRLRRRLPRRRRRGLRAARRCATRPRSCWPSPASSPRWWASSSSPATSRRTTTVPPAASSPSAARSPSTARASSSGDSCWPSPSAASCSSPSATSTAARPRSPARRPPCPAPTPRPPRVAARREHTEVYPLLMFAVFGMMLFPAANDLLTMFVGLEVLSLPLYLLSGLARRRRLLSQEAALKYFLLGAFSSGFFLYGAALIYGYAGSMDFAAHQRGGPQRRRQQQPAAHRHRPALGRPALQGRRGPVPGLDPRRLPGRPDPGHRLHGGRHQGRGVRRPHAPVLRRARRGPLVVAADAVDHRDAVDVRRRRAGDHAERHQAAAGLLLGRPHRLHPHRRARPRRPPTSSRSARSPRSRPCCST